MMRVSILIPMRGGVRECIAPMAALGFRSGQLSVWDMGRYTPETSSEINDVCQELNFTITALWCGWSGPVDWGYPGMYTTLGLVPSYMREQRMKELLLGASFARSIGVNQIVTHSGYLPDNPQDPNHIEIVQVLRHIGRTIAKDGQYFLFETGEELPVTLVQLINETTCDNMGVNFDPANLLINARANPSDALTLLIPYIRGMHAKDAVYPSGTSPKGKEVPIGQGLADFPLLLRKLFDAGYDGDITIEHEKHGNPERIPEIIRSKAYLESIIERLNSI